MDIYFRTILLLVLTFLTPVPCWSGASYDTIRALFEEKLGSANYNPEVRPVLDHSIKTNVSVQYFLNSVVEVDDVRQTMTTNGYFVFEWIDQLVTWDLVKYNMLYYIQPQPKQIWRPRMGISNTLEERDPFQDKASTLIAVAWGTVRWSPGLILPTSCPLKMDKYPFDVQQCFIEICPMNLYSDSLVLTTTFDKAQSPMYVPNKAWDLVSTRIDVIDIPVAETINLSCVQIHIEIERRPTYFVINIILPVVLLSFLNMFVFAIPVESGEKISYGITVLLALTVFLSLISAMLPQSSDAVPAVTIYLFSLLVGSVMSVLVTIGIVALYHKDVKEQKYLEAKANFQHAVIKLNNINKAIQPLNGSLTENQVSTPTSTSLNNNEETQLRENPKNRYHVICKYIDTVCFILFFLLWVAATLRFFVFVKS